MKEAQMLCLILHSVSIFILTGVLWRRNCCFHAAQAIPG